MNTSDFDYDLPTKLIAQKPLEPRDSSRLMILDRKIGSIQHAHFFKLGDYLRKGDLLVINETKVIPARIFARKIPSGGRVEILLLHRVDELFWEVLVRGKGIHLSKRLQIEGGPQGEVVSVFNGSRRLICFDSPIEPVLTQVGHVPLPPYIHTTLDDPERYQTVYARLPGSAAAPTAGLHFTPQLITRLESQGILFAKITLHVGLDTFSPVTEEAADDHIIHSEWCQISNHVSELVNQVHQDGGRIVAVGTTSVRTLESAAQNSPPGMIIGPYEGNTHLYILPGYQFKVVDTIITNFHLPRSTLIMLVSAFYDRASILHAYEVAKENQYRFYSFGDAMLIL